jgi:hypothetical protein
MTIRRVLLSRAIRLAAAGTLVEVVLSCGQEPAAAPRVISVGAAVAAKAAPTSPSVKSASPAFGDQGTTVDVHILGSGFTPGANAIWLLHGVADPAHVHTNSTTVVSSTEFEAD